MPKPKTPKRVRDLPSQLTLAALVERLKAIRSEVDLGGQHKAVDDLNALIAELEGRKDQENG